MTHRLITKSIRSVATLALFLGLAHAYAAEDDFAQCSQLFANGTPPVIQTPAEREARALCFSTFAVLHSGQSHTPIFVAERLNKKDLLDARKHRRTDRFYEEARLPRDERASLDDYRDSGFDRGHMAPAADMATEQSMAQSFSLANMVPQYPLNNRKSWASIENATRRYVMRASGDVYVITGPIYDSAPPTIGENKVWVPQHFYKLVYDPSAKRAWAHWLDNANEAKVGKPITYEELVRRTGIEFIPGWG